MTAKVTIARIKIDTVEELKEERMSWSRVPCQDKSQGVVGSTYIRNEYSSQNDNSPARETKTATVVHSIKGTNRKLIPKKDKDTSHLPV